MIKKIAILSLSFIVLTLTILVGQFIAIRPTPQLHQHLPSDAKAILKINNTNLLHRYFFDLLYKQPLTTAKYKPNFLSASPTLPILGIAAKSELYVFYEDWNNHALIGFLFKVGNKASLETYIEQFPFLVAAYTDELAAVLIVPEDLRTENQVLFQNYAQDLLVPNPNRTTSKIALAQSKNNTLFHLYLEGGSESLLQEIDMQFTFNDERIELYGKAIRNPLQPIDTIPFFHLTEPYKDNHLSLNIKQLPDTLAYYTNKLYKNIQLPNDFIHTQQLFFYGINLTAIDKKMVALPLMDGIVHYKEAPTNTKSSPSNKTYTLDTFSLGETTYYKKQLSKTAYYFGINPSPKIEYTTKLPSFKLAGNPSVLFTIEGKSFFAQLTQVVPFIQNSKNFLNDFKTFEITSEYSPTKDHLELNGIFEFGDMQLASLMLISFFLELDGEG